MPLNPNGKIDKPALPFPDTAQLHAVEKESQADELTQTEQVLSEIWSQLLPSAPSSIPVEENFFDLGGHSILATRLTFELRKKFVTDIPLSLIFDRPTLRSQAAAIDALRFADLGLGSQSQSADALNAAPQALVVDYAAEFEALASTYLKTSYSAPEDIPANGLNIFLTGGTGFLGIFILARLLSLEPVAKVTCLVRGKNDGDALARLKTAAIDRGVWKDAWLEDGRITTLAGDLGKERFGISTDAWSSLCETIHGVVHNGALVSEVH
jgi:L-aminoadipate-semialdehyde dehydrogenase